MFIFRLLQIGFALDSCYGVKALLADGLEGAIVVCPVQKLAIYWGTHDKLQHVVA